MTITIGASKVQKLLNINERWVALRKGRESVYYPSQSSQRLRLGKTSSTRLGYSTQLRARMTNTDIMQGPLCKFKGLIAGRQGSPRWLLGPTNQAPFWPALESSGPHKSNTQSQQPKGNTALRTSSVPNYLYTGAHWYEPPDHDGLHNRTQGTGPAHSLAQQGYRYHRQSSSTSCAAWKHGDLRSGRSGNGTEQGAWPLLPLKNPVPVLVPTGGPTRGTGTFPW